MSFDVFRSKVNALISSIDNGTTVVFSHEPETGQHIAVCSDGTTIVGNSKSLKVTVGWGSGHTAMAAI